MTMLEIFQETIDAIPVPLVILSVKEEHSKSKIRVKHLGQETTVDLKKACAPGEERDYCWNVAATAVSEICLSVGQLSLAKLWLDSIITHSKDAVLAAYKEEI